MRRLEASADLLTLDEIRVADTRDDILAGPDHPASQLTPGTTSKGGVAIAGADGYLFIANGANSWERQFLGELQIPPAWFESWTRLFEGRQSAAARHGVELWNVVVPEKQVIYPDKRWPDDRDVGANRPLRQLLPRLPGEARLVYPISELVAARAIAPAYWRHNSHWTASGCCAALLPLFAAMSARTGEEPLRFGYLREHAAQDLTAHFFDPPPPEDRGLLAPVGEVYFDNKHWETTGRPSGSSYGVRNPSAPDQRSVILFGDSFAFDAGLTSVLSAIFAQVVFVWSKDVVWDLVAEHAADLVIWEHAERFIGTLPQA